MWKFILKFCNTPDIEIDDDTHEHQENEEHDYSDSSSTVETNCLEKLIQHYKNKKFKKYEAFYEILVFVKCMDYYPSKHVSLSKEEMLTKLDHYWKIIFEKKSIDISPFHKYFGNEPKSSKMRLIIKSGVFPESELAHLIDENGQSFVHHAVIARHLEMLRCLLETGADPNLKDKKGNSPLFYCFSKLHKDGETVKLLKMYGADFNLKDSRGYTWSQRAQTKYNFTNLSVTKV